MYGMLVPLALVVAALCFLAPRANAEGSRREDAPNAPIGDDGNDDTSNVLVVMDFDAESPAWRNIDDVVMGGISSSRFRIEHGLGVFEGTVSLENSGGFASVRSAAADYDFSAARGLLLRVRGDGKCYALRLRTTDVFGGINYEARFETAEGDWMTVAIPFECFQPVYRGRKVRDAEPLDRKSVKTLGFLISEKQDGPFRLEVDWIGTYVAEPEGQVAMSTSWLVLVGGGAGAIVWMTVLYGVRRATRNAGVVDVGWAFGVGGLALVLAATASGDPWRRVLVAGLVGAWSLRLGFYLLVDRVIGAEEDGRYRALLQSWGEKAEPRLFVLYLAQAGFVVMFCMPLLPALNSTAPPGNLYDILAVCVWSVAVLGESLADRQLAAWREAPEHRGRTCRRGLWRYSRHPNYFFEWVHWWTYVLLAAGAPWAWLSLFGPVAMLLFLFRFTGIPYTEAQALKSRGEDYARYQRSTSSFFPWFPRNEPDSEQP
mgnify:CR=1 FL=1